MLTETKKETGIEAFKAWPTGNQVIPDLRIEATKPIPRTPTDDGREENWWAQLDAEATKIVDALTESLPGGVVSRIHAILTKRYANSLAIAWGEMSSTGHQRS